MKLADCNRKQRKAYLNIYHAANWMVGGLENTLLDYDKESEEFKNAFETLNNHEQLVNDLYETATHDIYGDGYTMFGAEAEKYLKDIRFCGKKWLLERCEARIKKLGY